MPADEGFYRNQKSLHLVFLWSALGLFAATVWMLAQDHLKSWKVHQREFGNVKREKLHEDLVAKTRAIDEQKLAELRARREQAQAKVEQRSSEVAELEKTIKSLTPQFEQEDLAFKFKKADYSELMSSYDATTKEVLATEGTDDALRRQRLLRQQSRLQERLKEMDDELQQLQFARDETDTKIKTAKKRIDEINKEVTQTKDEIDDLTGDVAKIERSIEDTRYTAGDAFRSVPVIDAFNPTEKIVQQALDDLTLDYNFKDVTRFDRCMTCHQGIDQTGLSKANGVKEPYCSHPHLDLYVGAQSPHPVEKFGCTICHQGQGTATSFDWASHTPRSHEQRERWTSEHGWFFNHFHEWPMLPGQFVQSSCLKCHHDPYEIPEAQTLLTGYKTVRTYGCFGCHEIGGYRDDGTEIGPHLRIAQKSDKPADRDKALRKVGPSLMRMAEKLTPEFVARWVLDPQAFRPNTRMPNYYHQVEEGYFGEGPEGEFDSTDSLNGLAYTEIHAITHFLVARSKEHLGKQDTAKLAEVPGMGNAAAGKELFKTKGCVACHHHKDHAAHAGATHETHQFGPDLSEVSAKFTSAEQHKWLRSWIKNPRSYNPNTLMPNTQVADQDVADIAAYLTSVPGKWAKEVTVPELDQDKLTALVLAFEQKSQALGQAQSTVNAMNTEQKLMYLGQRTISRLGCFGCHDVPDEEIQSAKPIGTPLADWGRKNPHKLAFDNVNLYVDEKLESEPESNVAQFYSKNDFYLWSLGHHQREGFLMQKVREPRSYDYKKIRRWLDRARMPRFAFNDSQREAVATFVVGLVGEEIHGKYLPNPSPRERAEVKGRGLLEQYNCVACHVIKPGEYRFQPAKEEADSLIALAKQQMSLDYEDFWPHSAWSAPESKGPELVIHGIEDGRENPDEAENPNDPRIFVRTWTASNLQGQNIPAGMKIGVPRSQHTPANVTPPVGGTFALELVEHLISKSPNPADAGERDKAWQRSPPPLIREGEKVQTAWLYGFLKDPVVIRPGVVLRMPKFNFKPGDPEILANYFAAAENVPYPYAEIPQRDEDYLATMDAGHAKFLNDAWQLITHKDMCVKCHPIGGFKPSGKPEELGPPLSRAPQRLRPEWMEHWIANPKRLLPYTQMPVNFEKGKEAGMPADLQARFQGTNRQRITAARDAVINYNKIVDDMLTEQRQQAVAAAAETKDAKEGKAQ